MSYFSRRRVKIALIVVLALSISFFIGRYVFLNYALNKITEKLDKYHLTFSTKDVSFKGLSSVQFDSILIKDQKGDTVLSNDTLLVRIRPFPLLIGNIRLGELHLNDTRIKLNGELIDSIRVSSSNSNSQIDSVTLPVNYIKSFERVFNLLFSSIPDEVLVDSFNFSYKRKGLNLKLFVPELRFEDKTVYGHMSWDDSLSRSACSVKGTIDKSNDVIEASIFGHPKEGVKLPYLLPKFEASVIFDTVKFTLNYSGITEGKLRFAGFAQAYGLGIEHKRIAPAMVKTDYGSAEFIFNIDKTSLELDSASKLKINKLSISPYIKYERDEHKKLIIRIPRFEFEASDLFQSFPENLFTSVREMKVSGKFAYQLNFFVNWNDPDSIKLESSLENINFKILHYGGSNLSMIKDTFIHTVYESDRSVKKILVSPENPDFVTLDNISPFLKYSVLTSEDGGFFHHKGFNEESIKNSITTNIKEGRFAKGGSTISQQLIKNIYLTRNKTVSRKLEEMLMVWMIENLHLVSKERMFEVYLNIIEWGPGIYGIKPAAKFYFQKKPSELTLSESIFMASIIPSPKYFKYCFKEDFTLKEHYQWFYKRLPEYMIKREQIHPEDTIGLAPNIILTGEAHSFLLKPDTTRIDSTEIILPDFQDNLEP